MTIKKENISKYINWSLAALTITIFLVLIGYIIADNRIQAEQIFINSNRLTVLENRVEIDYTKQMGELTKNLNVLNNRQTAIDSKLGIIIILATDTNKKIDRHLADSINNQK